MKQKIVLLTLLVLLTLSCTSISFAEVSAQETGQGEQIDVDSTVDIDTDGKEIVPCYIAAGSATAGLSISTKGVASCLAQVTSKNSTVMDAAKATITIKNSSGTAIKSWSKVALKKSGTTYRTTLSYTLPKRGSYSMTATIYCYKKSKLVEKINKKTASKSY